MNQESIEKLTKDSVKSDSIFLVEVELKKSHNGTKVNIFVDGDEDVSIHDCARISRELSEKLENSAAFDGAYTLEVSSPGLGRPLKLMRQYKKNIGRTLDIKASTGERIKGILGEVVGGESLRIEIKKKKKEIEEKIVVLEDIISAHVVPTFQKSS